MPKVILSFGNFREYQKSIFFKKFDFKMISVLWRFVWPAFGGHKILVYKYTYLFSAASRGSATAQFGVLGPVRFTVGVSVSARRVTKRVSEQCLCKEEGELERQNACAVIGLSGFLAVIFSEMPVIIFPEITNSDFNYHFPKCISAEMLARFSIYAKGWRSPCNIESETATDHGKNQH